MTLVIPAHLLEAIQAQGEGAYPEEGAGFILGSTHGHTRTASAILPQANLFEVSERRRRYRISPQDMLRAEREADAMGLEIIGIFHSHPDHPAEPSAYDLEYSLPWFFYLITSVREGHAGESRVWLMLEDRSGFTEIALRTQTATQSKEA